MITCSSCTVRGAGTAGDHHSYARVGHVEESFSGDIEGDGVVEFLQAGRTDGSASFVGIERVTGKVAPFAVVS